jgi:hypothetical protein
MDVASLVQRQIFQMKFEYFGEPLIVSVLKPSWRSFSESACRMRVLICNAPVDQFLLLAELIFSLSLVQRDGIVK